MAGLGQGSPDRLTSPYGAAGSAQIFPLAAAGKLILGRKRWRDGPTVGEGGPLWDFLQLPFLSPISTGPHSLSGARVLLLQARSSLLRSTVILFSPLAGSPGRVSS